MTLAECAAMPSCEHFHPHEVRLRSATPHDNPFFVDLRARVTAPSGRARIVHGFHDSEDTWRVRFSPNELGIWRYVTESSDAGLHAQSGEIVCVATTNQAVHGALTVDPHHPHHFLYEDGARPFVLGYEANWL